jgi:hypothetical protein
MDGISVAESSKAKRAPKVLHHLEVHPQMGGGVRVEHHYSSYEHKMEPHEFGEGEGGKFHEHLSNHTGLSHEDVEEQGSSEPEPYK